MQNQEPGTHNDKTGAESTTKNALKYLKTYMQKVFLGVRSPCFVPSVPVRRQFWKKKKNFRKDKLELQLCAYYNIV